MSNNGGAENYPFASQKRSLEEAGWKSAQMFSLSWFVCPCVDSTLLLFFQMNQMPRSLHHRAKEILDCVRLNTHTDPTANTYSARFLTNFSFCYSYWSSAGCPVPTKVQSDFQCFFNNTFCAQGWDPFVYLFCVTCLQCQALHNDRGVQSAWWHGRSEWVHAHTFLKPFLRCRVTHVQTKI